MFKPYTWKISGNFWKLMCMWGGGVNEEGAYSKFWFREEGVIREEGLLESGA